MAANSGFPLSLDVKGYPVLVLGGDEEASEKTQRLLEAGAKVTVVAPSLNDTLKDLAASAKVVHRGRHFRDTDLESAILVMNMVRGDKDFSRAVTMPAVVASGHLRVAISTSGVAPALSGFMKEDMEKIFGEEFAAFVEWLGELREKTKANEPEFEKRRALLREALDGFRVLGKVQYPKVWLDERAKLAVVPGIKGEA